MSKARQEQVKTVKYLDVSIPSFAIVFDTNRKKCSNVLILFYNVFKLFEQHYINSFHIRIDVFHIPQVSGSYSYNLKQ